MWASTFPLVGLAAQRALSSRRSTRASKPPDECDSRITPLVTIGLDADVGHLHLTLSLFASHEALNRRIPTPPQYQIDPLQYDVMDF